MTKPAAQSDIDRTNPFQLAAARAGKRAEAKANPEVESSANRTPGDAISRDAALNSLYRPKKASTTVRIDADVMLWLRAGGKGYQSRINEILRHAMIASLHSAEAE